MELPRRLNRVVRHFDWLRPGASTRMLLISDGAEDTSEQQFAPIWRNPLLLRRRLGLSVRWLPASAVETKSARFFQRFDVIGIKFSFRRDAGDVLETVRRLRKDCSAKLVYFDGDDDSAIQWPAVLEAVDLYVKKHMFADPAWYQRRFLGKSNLVDYVAKVHGVAIDHEIKETRPIDPALLHKVHLGWNIGLDDPIAELRSLAPDDAAKHVDVTSRAHANPDLWIAPLRSGVAKELSGLGGAVVMPTGRVPRSDYLNEMLSSKICVSPFGYGELCWRDFEAVMCGCLLVKPDMSHIRTSPDIFQPGITYVPVAWDFSDLRETCARYLADENGRREIAARSRRTLLDALTPEWFVGRMQALLAAL